MFSEKQWLPTAENPHLLHEFIGHILYFAQFCIEFSPCMPIHFVSIMIVLAQIKKKKNFENQLSPPYITNESVGIVYFI